MAIIMRNSNNYRTKNNYCIICRTHGDFRRVAQCIPGTLNIETEGYNSQLVYFFPTISLVRRVGSLAEGFFMKLPGRSDSML